MNDVKIVTICGSMKFSKRMIEISEELELKQGYAVIQCVYNLDGKKHEGLDGEMLDRIHRKKIEISNICQATKKRRGLALMGRRVDWYSAKVKVDILSTFTQDAIRMFSMSWLSHMTSFSFVLYPR